MSQPNQKSQKSQQKRQRTNSQSLTPQKGDYVGGTAGGGGSSKKSGKSQNIYHQSNNSPFSQQSPAAMSVTTVNQFDNIKTGQYNGATKKHPSNSASFNFTPNTNFTGKKGYAGAVISGAQQQNKSGFGVVEAPLNDEESNRLNSTALRRIDPDFLKLHGTASQVAVYRYNPATQSWDKTDTVGCLFLYERNAPPKFGLVVMNRKNANNFIQCFGPDGQVVLHMPYLLLRAGEDVNKDPTDGSQVIHCIWFYDAQDCVASATILKNMGLQFEGETEGQGIGLQRSNSCNLIGHALYQILQKKKGTSPLPTTPKEKCVSTPKVLTAEELESQMLHESEVKAGERRDFLSKLAAANSNGDGVHATTANVNSPGLMFGTPTSSSAQNLGGTVLQQFLNLSVTEKQQDIKGRVVERVTSVSPSQPPTVSHVISSQNKMRTVEQLERDMKKERSSDSSSSASTSTTAIQNELMQTLGISGSEEEQAAHSRALNKRSQRSLLDNIIGKSVDETDPEELRLALQNIDPNNQLILVTETVPGSSETRLTWRINRSSSARKDNDSTFTTPTGEFLSASGTRCSSQLGFGADAKYFDTDPSSRSVDVKPTPLTKDQLHQALLYLLQNDPEFINKIHDAYVKSLQQAFDVRRF